MPMDVRPISAATVRAFLATQPDPPLQQWPSFTVTKSEWSHLYLGWFDGEQLIGTALVLGRKLPKINRWFAYCPEGPVLDWHQANAVDQLVPMLKILHDQGAFMVKIGPRLRVRDWSPSDIRAALNDPQVRRWRDVPSHTIASNLRLQEQLSAAGWLQYQAPTVGFGGTLQPRYAFELNLRGQTEASLLANMNSQWRRNIKRAEKKGVQVRLGDFSDLHEFHRLLQLSGARGGYQPRDLPFFQRMWQGVQNDPGEDQLQLYLGSVNGRNYVGMLLATTGNRVSYTYGGTDSEGSDFRPSNAVQWRMVQDALAAGRHIFDLRGAADNVDPVGPEFGLTAFKAGLGAQAVELLGEWDFITRPILGRAFRSYRYRQRRWPLRPH